MKAFPQASRRLCLLAASAGLAFGVLTLGGCAGPGGGDYASSRLARITPDEFTTVDGKNIAVGVDFDSRVPAALNRGPELIAAVVPVDHNAWEPIGARLPLRPLNLLGDTPDKAAGKSLRAWSESPPGRLRLTYVLTDEGREELALLQQKFRDLLKKHPSGSGKGGALRIRADIYRMMPTEHAYGSSRLQTWLQLSVAEGPFLMWDGQIAQMR